MLRDNDLEGRPPEARYRAGIEDKAAHPGMLEALRDYGFVLVCGIPADPDRTEAIASLAGPLRITNYGKIYEFSCKPDTLAFGDLPDDGIRPFYRALRLLQKMLFDPVHRITVPSLPARRCSSTTSACCMADRSLRSTATAR